MFYCPDCKFVCDTSFAQKKSLGLSGGASSRKNSADREVDNAVNYNSSDDDTEERARTKKRSVIDIDDSDDSSDDSDDENDGDSGSDDGGSSSEDEARSGKRGKKRMGANYAEIVHLVVNNEPIDDIELTNYNERDLLKHPDFQALNAKMRERVLGAVQHMLSEGEKRVKGSSSGVSKKVYWLCINCGFQTPLEAGSIVYRQNVTTVSDAITDFDKYRDMSDDPTLPRTRIYTCPNSKCVSHKDPSKAEKVTIRPNSKSYKNISVCCACKTAWD